MINIASSFTKPPELTLTREIYVSTNTNHDAGRRMDLWLASNLHAK